MPVKDGESLPGGENVLRLGPKSKDGYISPIVFKVSPEVFALSSCEKQDPIPKLSVWAMSITTLAQACAIYNHPAGDTHFIQLTVDQIRSIRPIPENEEIASLDVVWHVIEDDKREGIDGHAGITGLAQNVAKKAQRCSFRQQLADIASLIDYHED